MKIEKTTEFELYGKIYPLSLTLDAMQEIAREYGDIGKAFEGLEEGAMNEESIARVKKLLKITSEQGCALYDFIGREHADPLGDTTVGLLVNAANMSDIISLLFGVAESDLKREVLTKEVVDPNESATQTE